MPREAFLYKEDEGNTWVAHQVEDNSIKVGKDAKRFSVEVHSFQEMVHNMGKDSMEEDTTKISFAFPLQSIV